MNLRLATLEENRLLRHFAIFLLYAAQGVPVGLFWFVIPAWLVANGAGAAQVGFFLGIMALPWSLKLVNGFIIDRFTFLAMGRRRVWIVGSQLAMVVALLLCAVINPVPEDIRLIAVFAFVINAAITFHDVAIDGLTVDIMPDEERAQASGMMFGGQAIGIAAGIALAGFAMTYSGSSGAYLAIATILSVAVIFTVSVRERAGERHLPWTAGSPAVHNLSIQADRWWPILRNTFRSLIQPASLVWSPVLLTRGINHGVWIGITPLLAVQGAGWSEGEVTSLTGLAQLVAGILGLTLGAFMGHKLGAKRATQTFIMITILASILMLMVEDSWASSTFLFTFIFGWVIIDILNTVVALPISMKLCDKTAVATQFTTYMSIINIGTSIGAALIVLTASYGGIETMIWIVIGANVIGAICLSAMPPIKKVSG